MLKALAMSLLLTLVFELGFALIWGVRGRREITLAVLVNCLTNPPAVLLYSEATARFPFLTIPAAVLIESAVVLVEWRCYRACSEQITSPFVYALMANGFSYGLGVLIQRI